MTNSQTSSAPPAPEPEERVEALCPKHGGYSARVIPHPFGGKAFVSACPKCQEDSRIDAERERVEQARKQRESRVRVLLGRSGIPVRFHGVTVEGYSADLPAQRRVRDACQRYVDGFEGARQRGGSIVMCGRPGTGKTHPACAIAESLISQHLISAEFFTVLSAIRTIKDTYRKDSERSETDAIDALLSPDLLILDEVGVQVGSEHEKMLLFEIINERYQQCRPTILISNLAADALNDYLGERIMDRFRECGGVLAFDWQSHRGKRAA